ncbi:MotA/TolQ/ExbB proton channel family protein [Cochlodiniinecator piscidefendens]|uniref:MotA/TolQ/ExbB proton channel family protein n=1 Tax=Cochlodiniinecator piscidefendens TaxID=2715756 RepID=UPI0014077A7C|nr:MotA/TolQ/ExbB proton channel family protein [Cochlodiniinecator piscidefendens]
MFIQNIVDAVTGFIALGGPVVALLLLMSVVSVAVVTAKIWQFHNAGVGRFRDLEHALNQWDSANKPVAVDALNQSKNHIKTILLGAILSDKSTEASDRYETQLDEQMARLETAFRLLDSIAQLAPLLGLFGTVLGMIEAFQSLQDAGTSVDPSLLAGGIWVALMTTAVGLAVAMPTSLLLTWLESRVARERVFSEKALQSVLHPLAHEPQHGQ